MQHLLARSTRPGRLARSTTSGGQFELFLVASVASLLLIRFYLAWMGFPQVGGGGLHIAHLLWGGLLMLLAILLLLGFLGGRIKATAALLGGIGFGTFIDELGKFITSDNNYFFEPTVALIYIIFILLFLGLRAIRSPRFSPRDRLASALEESIDLMLSEPSAQRKAEILRLLEASDSQNPLAQALIAGLQQLPGHSQQVPGLFERLKGTLRQRSRRLVASPLFVKALVVLLVVNALLSGAVIMLLVVVLNTLPTGYPISFIQVCPLAFSLLADLLIVVGVVWLPRSRLRAYHCFKGAMLVSIFFVQVFAFYGEQFAALGSLVFNLLVLSALNYMIAQQRLRQTAI